MRPSNQDKFPYNEPKVWKGKGKRAFSERWAHEQTKCVSAYAGICTYIHIIVTLRSSEGVHWRKLVARGFFSHVTTTYDDTQCVRLDTMNVRISRLSLFGHTMLHNYFLGWGENKTYCWLSPPLSLSFWLWECDLFEKWCSSYKSLQEEELLVQSQSDRPSWAENLIFSRRLRRRKQPGRRCDTVLENANTCPQTFPCVFFPWVSFNARYDSFPVAEGNSASLSQSISKIQ